MIGNRAWTIRTIWLLTIASLVVGVPRAPAQEEPLQDEVIEVERELEDETGGVFALAAVEAADPPQGVALDQVNHAALLFAGGAGGTYLPAPVLDTEYEIRVTGLIVRARVTQRFSNPGTGFVEGLYVFPLPENAAVDHLVMKVGDRRIEGRIQERGQAEKTYQVARDEGKKASLVRQHRPNLFTTAVANIGPAEDIVVEIEYQQAARYDVGEFSLRVPLAITRRFTPPPSGRNLLAGGRPGPGSAAFAASGIEPDPVPPGPGLAVGAGGRQRQVRLTIDLDAGMPLSRIESTYHEIRDVESAPGRHQVMLARPSVPADRDFELVWVPEVGSAPKAALFAEEMNGEWYALLMVLPPPPARAQSLTLPRDVVFVVDTSGSMKGGSIEQAKAALLWALGRLGPQDRFNVIRFESQTTKLFETSLGVGPQSLEQARRFVSSFEAGGGTQMLPAVEAALAEQPLPGVLRQVVFITDGAVGNESELFSHIHKNLKGNRLFTVGIGGAPNSHFMTRAARFGHGTFTHIGKLEEVGEKIGLLFAKLESPVMTDVEVAWSHPVAELFPDRFTDLYVGEPLLATAKLGGLGPSVTLTGRLQGTSWSRTVVPPKSLGSRGIEKLWARSKIDYLLESLHFGADPDTTRQAVTQLALDHHLVSRYTSLVAVDVQKTAPARASGNSATPANLPQTATSAALLRWVGLGLLILSLTVLTAHRRRAWHAGSR